MSTYLPTYDEKVQSHARTSTEGPSTNVDVPKLPFLMWNMSGNGDTNSDSTSGPRLSRLLSNVGTNLSSWEVTGRFYSGAYGCSLVELEQRHAFRSDNHTEPKDDGTEADNDDAKQTQSTKQRVDKGKEKYFTAASTSLNSESLFRQSKELLELFIPLQHFQDIHPTIERYWGSLDRIFRVGYTCSP